MQVVSHCCAATNLTTYSSAANLAICWFTIPSCTTPTRPPNVQPQPAIHQTVSSLAPSNNKYDTQSHGRFTIEICFHCMRRQGQMPVRVCNNCTEVSAIHCGCQRMCAQTGETKGQEPSRPDLPLKAVPRNVAINTWYLAQKPVATTLPKAPTNCLWPWIHCPFANQIFFPPMQYPQRCLVCSSD